MPPNEFTFHMASFDRKIQKFCFGMDIDSTGVVFKTVQVIKTIFIVINKS